MRRNGMKVHATITEIKQMIEERFHSRTGKILDDGWQLEIELERGWRIQKENLFASSTYGVHQSKSTAVIQPTQRIESQLVRGTQADMNFRSER